jgi:hypothetical protein
MPKTSWVLCKPADGEAEMQRHSTVVLTVGGTTKLRQDTRSRYNDAFEQNQRLAQSKQATYPFLWLDDARSNLQSVETNDYVGMP